MTASPRTGPDATEVEVVRAPPRRIVLARLGAMLAIGALVLLLGKELFFPWLRGYLSVSGERAEALYRFKLVMLGAGTVVLGLAAWAGWLGFRVLQQGRWPLEGSFVVRDTPVRRGRRARARGILLLALALLFAADAIGLVLAPWLMSR